MNSCAMFPLTILPFPAADRVLQSGQSCGIWHLLFHKLDETFNDFPVSAHLVEQVIEQGRLPHRAAEQLLSDMRFPAQLADHGFHPQREPAFRSVRRRFILPAIDWIDQVDPAVGAYDQVVINICAAIAAFDLVIFGRGSDAGWQTKLFLCISSCRPPTCKNP